MDTEAEIDTEVDTSTRQGTPRIAGATRSQERGKRGFSQRFCKEYSLPTP